MKNFQNWLEEHELNTPTPSSNEVIRTGLQPQVDAQNIQTKSREEQDKISALDSHFENIHNLLSQINDAENPKLSSVKDLWEKFIDAWESIKYPEQNNFSNDGLGSNQPSEKQLNMMKNNQPLPEEPRPSGPGTFGNM